MDLPNSVTTVLEDRGKEYGEAWLVAGNVIKYVGNVSSLTKLMSTPFFHNWVIILSKMIRILQSPTKIDHWKDIAGYATLVMQYLEQGDQK